MKRKTHSLVKITVFWGVTSCSLVDRHQLFGRNFYAHYQVFLVRYNRYWNMSYLVNIWAGIRQSVPVKCLGYGQGNQEIMVRFFVRYGIFPFSKSPRTALVSPIYLGRELLHLVKTVGTWNWPLTPSPPCAFLACTGKSLPWPLLSLFVHVF